MDGGVDQEPWLEGWGGVGAGWQFEKKGESRGKSRKGLACLAVPQEGARAWGNVRAFGSGRVGVLFFESVAVAVCLVLSRGGVQGLRFRGG